MSKCQSGFRGPIGKIFYLVYYGDGPYWRVVEVVEGHVSVPKALLGFSFSPCCERELPAVTEKFKIPIWLEIKSHRLV